MRSIIAVIRMGLAILALTIGVTAILLVSWIPFKYRRAPLAGWATTFMARSVLAALNIKPIWNDKPVFLKHAGYIFPNHTSYADIVLMASLSPVRFLAKAEVGKWPLIGTIARSNGYVFVKRESKESRTAARKALGNTDHFPPIILFPEGGTGPPGPLRPFRYGAFEIVVGGQVPFLPCIINYGENAEAVSSGGENLFRSIYKQLATAKGAVVAKIVPLRPVTPKPDDDPKLLATAIHGAMEALRKSQEDESKLIQPGL